MNNENIETKETNFNNNNNSGNTNSNNTAKDTINNTITNNNANNSNENVDTNDKNDKEVAKSTTDNDTNKGIINNNELVESIKEVASELIKRVQDITKPLSEDDVIKVQELLNPSTRINLLLQITLLEKLSKSSYIQDLMGDILIKFKELIQNDALKPKDLLSLAQILANIDAQITQSVLPQNQNQPQFINIIEQKNLNAIQVKEEQVDSTKVEKIVRLAEALLRESKE